LDLTEQFGIDIVAIEANARRRADDGDRTHGHRDADAFEKRAAQ